MLKHISTINLKMDAVSEFTAKINQEIKEKKLTSKDAEYYKLKMRDTYNRKYKPQGLCPTCGKLLSRRVLEFRHTCKATLKPNEVPGAQPK